MTNRLVVTAIAVAVWGCLVVTGQQQAQSPAVYSLDQAAAGKTAYESSCGKCHLEGLTGRHGDPGEVPPASSLSDNMQKTLAQFGGKTPPLVGSGFMAKWKTTRDLSLRVKSAAGAFPPENSNEETYLKVTAYILQSNGARSGTQALTADTAVPIQSLEMNHPAENKQKNPR
jgi:S-disulfanyl-L-cysteine oxidoreductase SoxD